MKIGPRIRKLRKKNNLTVEQVAKELKVDAEKVEKWETNQLEIGNHYASQMARLFNVSMKELTGQDIEMEEGNAFVRFGKMYLQNLLIIGGAVVLFYLLKYIFTAVN